MTLGSSFMFVCGLFSLFFGAILVFSTISPVVRELAYGLRLRRLSKGIALCLKRMEAVFDDYSSYLTKGDWRALLAESSDLHESLAEVPERYWRGVKRFADLERFDGFHTNKNALAERNARYKERELELCREFFDDIGGKSLDAQQRDAVVTDESANLVVAGAGSGKSLTVVGKVKYLVEKKGVAPEDILVTSFTRASVDDLAAKIEAAGISGVSARTFHKIGYDQLGGADIANEGMLSKCVEEYLGGGMDDAAAAAFIEFYGLRAIADLNSRANESASERMLATKSSDLRTLNGLLAGPDEGLETWRRERVKSAEELLIANFLFLNGVEYEYEKPYSAEIPEDMASHLTRHYRPDFYLPEYDLWLEHFGVNAKGVPTWIESDVERRRYMDGMRWKRELHRRCGTRLLESYSFWNEDQDLLNKVAGLLEGNGVELRPDPARNARLCRELLRDRAFYSSIGKLVATFISLSKANNESLGEVEERAREQYRGNGTMMRRFQLFMAFARPAFEMYRGKLKEDGLVDFDDMINLAAEKISHSGIDAHYRYVIVDEYQDISKSRLGLILAIRAATGAKLMCVGDDWQAIYRFAGSDVTLFTNCAVLFDGCNYRPLLFSNPLFRGLFHF